MGGGEGGWKGGGVGISKQLPAFGFFYLPRPQGVRVDAKGRPTQARGKPGKGSQQRFWARHGWGPPPTGGFGGPPATGGGPPPPPATGGGSASSSSGRR